jgi:hypothetical protein
MPLPGRWCMSSLHSTASFVALEQRAGVDDSVETPTRNGGAGKVSSEPYPVNDGWWTAVTATRNQTIPQ